MTISSSIAAFGMMPLMILAYGNTLNKPYDLKSCPANKARIPKTLETWKAYNSSIEMREAFWEGPDDWMKTYEAGGSWGAGWAHLNDTAAVDDDFVLPDNVKVQLDNALPTIGAIAMWSLIWLIVTAVPVALGMWVRYKSNRIANRLVSAGSLIGMVFILGIILIQVAKKSNRDLLAQTDKEVYAACTIIGIVGCVMGYVVARIARIVPHMARSISFETGIQNGPLCIGIASAVFFWSGRDVCLDMTVGFNQPGAGDAYDKKAKPPVIKQDYIDDLYKAGDDATCSIDYALMIPLFYSLFISILSPFILLFMLYGCCAIKENMLWIPRKEYFWLWEEHEDPVQYAKSYWLIDEWEKVVAKHGHKRAFGFKKTFTVKGQWTHWTHKKYLNETKHMAYALLDMGHKEQEGISIFSINCQNWNVTALASMFVKGMTVGHYITNTKKQLTHVYNDSESTFLLIDFVDRLKVVKQSAHELKNVKKLIVMNKRDIQVAGYKASQVAPDTSNKLEGKDEDLPDWCNNWVYMEDLIEEAHKFPQSKKDELEAEITRRRAKRDHYDTCILMYTSGTTGAPKGVMISHVMLQLPLYYIGRIWKVSPDEQLLSYLPLSHIAEQLLSVWAHTLYGFCLYYAAADALRGSLPITMQEVGPSFFFGVPRVWEKIQVGVTIAGKRPCLCCWMIPMVGICQCGTRRWRKFTGWAKVKGLEWSQVMQDSKTMKEANKKKPSCMFCAREVVHQNLKMALGLNRCRVFFSGAAPMSKDTLMFFASLGINVLQFYGLSETTGPVTSNLEAVGQFRLNSVGKVMPYVQVKMGVDGEILLKSECCTKGYWKNQEATDELIDKEGFLRTGDIGIFDVDQFLRITDRKKHLLITAAGENVPPAPLEGAVRAKCTCLSYCVMTGDRQKFMTALLCLDESVIFKTAVSFGITGYIDPTAEARANGDDPSDVQVKEREDLVIKLTQELIKSKDLKTYLDKNIEAANDDFPRAFGIKKWKLLPREFKDVGHMAELTPTKKVKNKIVSIKYNSEITDMYGADYIADKTASQAATTVTTKKVMKGLLYTKKHWTPGRSVLVMVVMTKDGSQMVVHSKTGRPPSVQLQEETSVKAGSVMFKWLNQIGQLHQRVSIVNIPSNVDEEFNLQAAEVMAGINSLRQLVEDEDPGSLVDYVTNYQIRANKKQKKAGITPDPNEIICFVRQVDNPKDLKLKNSSYTWKKRSESGMNKRYAQLVHRMEASTSRLEDGIHAAYLVTMSNRKGLFVATSKMNHGMIPTEPILQGKPTQAEIDFIQTFRLRLKLEPGATVDSIFANPGPGCEKVAAKVKAAMESFRSTLGFEDAVSPKDMIDNMYDHELIKLDTEGKVLLLVFAHVTVLNTAKDLPEKAAKEYELVSMSQLEPLMYSTYHFDLFAEMQGSLIMLQQDVMERKKRLKETDAKNQAARKAEYQQSQCTCAHFKVVELNETLFLFVLLQNEHMLHLVANSLAGPLSNTIHAKNNENHKCPSHPDFSSLPLSPQQPISSSSYVFGMPSAGCERSCSGTSRNPPCRSATAPSRSRKRSRSYLSRTSSSSRGRSSWRARTRSRLPCRSSARTSSGVPLSWS